MMTFDKKEYEEELKEKIQDLAKFCMFNKIPLFVTACVSNDETDTEYFSEMISPDVLNLKLTDNRFPKYVNVGLGFETVPANEIIEVEF